MEYITAKTILSPFKKDNNWFGASYGMNLYRGCNHGCIYCDSRSNCYHVPNFDTVCGKENALGILERELKSKKRAGVINIGAMSDSYNIFETKEQLTRGALKLIDKFGFGVALATKSDGVIRDIDILQSINSHSPVNIKFSITTTDDKLAKKIEPRASLPSKRLNAMTEIAAAGIYTGTLMMPILPFIEDNAKNVLNIVEATHRSGGSYIFPGLGVTLRENQRDYYYEKLETQFPGLKQKYISTFGEAYSCARPIANQLFHIIRSRCNELGLKYQMSDIVAQYITSKQDEQLSFF